MLCCSVTTSSTVAGRHGSYSDMQYLKVSLPHTPLFTIDDFITFVTYYFTGATAYVLTESPAGVGYWLWNPHTGKHYTQHEPYTPLTSVGCAINEENVRLTMTRSWHWILVSLSLFLSLSHRCGPIFKNMMILAKCPLTSPIVSSGGLSFLPRPPSLWPLFNKNSTTLRLICQKFKNYKTG